MKIERSNIDRRYRIGPRTILITTKDKKYIKKKYWTEQGREKVWEKLSNEDVIRL